MDTALDSVTLREAYCQTGAEQKSYDIPWIVWLLENPDSPLPFPGQIHLREHDYLHIIFGLDRSSESEAYLVGFAMGLDAATRPWHLLILKFVSQWLYPKEYKFNSRDISVLENGFREGRNPKYKNINIWDFSPYLDCHISDIRFDFGFQQPELARYHSRNKETTTMPYSILYLPQGAALADLRPP